MRLHIRIRILTTAVACAVPGHQCRRARTVGQTRASIPARMAVLTPGTTLVQSAHIDELRAAVIALE